MRPLPVSSPYRQFLGDTISFHFFISPAQRCANTSRANLDACRASLAIATPDALSPLHPSLSPMSHVRRSYNLLGGGGRGALFLSLHHLAKNRLPSWKRGFLFQGPPRGMRPGPQRPPRRRFVSATSLPPLPPGAPWRPLAPCPHAYTPTTLPLGLPLAGSTGGPLRPSPYRGLPPRHSHASGLTPIASAYVLCKLSWPPYDRLDTCPVSR